MLPLGVPSHRQQGLGGSSVLLLHRFNYDVPLFLQSPHRANPILNICSPVAVLLLRLQHSHLCHHSRLCGVWRVEDGNSQRRVPVCLYIARQQDWHGTWHVAPCPRPWQCRLCKQCCTESGSHQHHAPRLLNNSRRTVDAYLALPYVLYTEQGNI